MADKTQAAKTPKTTEEIVEAALRSIQSASRRAIKALEGVEGDSFVPQLRRIGLAAQRLAIDWEEAGLLAED